MNKVLQQVLAGIVAVTLLSTVSVAAVKVRVEEMAEIKTVAVVGYSFWRDVQLEPASIKKLKREVVELKDTDPEYHMMQEADERVMEMLQGLGEFEIIPREDVLANELYQSGTKDPESKMALNWYFPKGYQVIKLKKKNAVALCEELGVDAVVLIEFKHAGGTSGSSFGGVYNKSKTEIALQGEITMFNSSGKEVISGATKSEKLLRGTSQGWGDQDNGISINTEQDAPNIDEFYHSLLDSYLISLSNSLSKQ